MSRVHWLALMMVPGIGGATARDLLARFGSVEAVFDTPAEELLQVPRITADSVARMHQISLDGIEAELSSLADEGFDILTWDDADYPANLRLVGDAPPVLFLRGELRTEDHDAVAIVGTRQPTEARVRVAQEIAQALAAGGLTIVSGLAVGIDTAAHRGALRARTGRTLAVLGSGLRAIHPRENCALAEQVSQRGALLSEFHPNMPPRGPTLMARDRIVSGLSRAVIVIEAGEKSGSLDTAAKARRQGRPVLAVAGSPGTDGLLARGEAECLDPARLNPDSLRQWLRQPGILRPQRGESQEQLRLWE
jgi:DNA processing protein